MRNSDFRPKLSKLSYALALSGFWLFSPTATYSQNVETPEFSVPVHIIHDKASAERARIERVVQEQHDAEDLVAQQRAAIAGERAADAAETQIRLAWYQLSVSIVGALGLIVTLLLTWRSTRAAAAAATAAVNANNVTRQNFELDQRPWIRLERPVINLAEHENTFAVQFSLEAINVGKTPAKETELHLQLSFGKLKTPGAEGVESFAQSLAAPGTWRNSQKIVFPNASRPLDDVVLLEESPPSDQSCRIRYCVNYKGASGSSIYHTAGQVIFPMSRLMSASRAKQKSWKYSYHGTSSVA